MIDSVKDIKIEETRAQIACMLNEIWHSRLPKLHWSNVVRSGDYVCYVFKYQEAIVGTSIWSSPVSRILAKDKNKLELRRMALSNVCPKNTASFVIAVMTKIISHFIIFNALFFIFFPHIMFIMSYNLVNFINNFFTIFSFKIITFLT